MIDGARILVTGASSGIGAATARRLADRGARLALLARGDGLDAVVREARRRGAETHPLRADATDRAELAAAVGGAVASLGGLDAAILGVGASAFGRFDEVSAEDFDRVVATTFGTVVDSVRLLLPELERSGGTLVVLGSGASSVPLPLMSAYVASKHAVAGFLSTLRVELAASRSRVRISVVHPGPVDTPFWRHATTPPDRKAAQPPFPYDPEAVARALVTMVEAPRRELTVGGMMIALDGAYRLAAPAVEAAMAVAARLIRPQPGAPANPGALHVPTGSGREESHGRGPALVFGGRPSLLTELRLTPGRLARAASR